jgi:hypothetical protein
MRSPIAFAIVAVSIGIISQRFAGGQASTGIGTTSKTASANAPAPGATPDESKTDESDDTLYRGKTTESEVQMLLDDGPLHFKTRPKEKIQEVDSLKKLQSSGTDPKFQGTLLNADINAIKKVSTKAQETRGAADEEEARFKTKRLTFTADTNGEPKKAQSDSSPSPTPSPTASPTKKNSGAPKQ